MEIPTVKKCCCFSLKTIGLMFGCLQLFIYIIVMVINLFLHGFPLIPIIMMPIATSIGWIYGIQEKKPVLMLPFMIPFALAALAGICFVPIYSLGAVAMIPNSLKEISTCTYYSHSYDGGSGTCITTHSYSLVDLDIAGMFVGIFFLGCFATCVVSYVTIVLYSVYKSIEEERKSVDLRIPITATSNI